MKVRLPLAGSIVTRNESLATQLTKDQTFQNCFAERVINPLTGNASLYLHKRQGLVATTLDSTSGYTGMTGACIWSGYSTGVQGVFAFVKTGTGVRINGTTSGLIGAVISGSYGAAAHISETIISGVANLTAILLDAAGVWHAWYIAQGGGSWTEITDVDYPINQTPALKTVGEMVHMDGYAFIMDSMGQIWNSDINSLANWTVTSFINAQFSPDGGVGLAKHKNYIVAFGRNSIEFFTNAGNPSGSPLARAPGGASNIGAYAGPTTGTNTVYRSIVTDGDVVYFVGVAAENGGVGIYRILDTQIKKISTAAIDRVLAGNIQGGGNSFTVMQGVFALNGLTHLMVQLGVTNSVFCYCIESDFWWQFVDTLVISACAGYAGRSWLNSNDAAPALYKIDGSSPYQDNGATYSAVVRSSNLDFGTNQWKFFQSATLIGDRQTVPGGTQILWSDNDYQTFSNDAALFINLPGTSGSYLSTPDANVLDITGDIDIIAHVSLTDWTPASTTAIVAKCVTGTSQVSFLLLVNTAGKLLFQTSPDGTVGAIVSGTSTVATSFTDGQPFWLRATLDVNDGSGNRMYTFYTAPDQSGIPSSWTQLGATVTTSGTTSIFNSTSLLEVGSFNGGTVDLLSGNVYAAYVYNGIGGSLAASMVVSDNSNNPYASTSWISTLTGETWTIHGSGAIVTASCVDMSTDLPQLTQLGATRFRRAFQISDSVNRAWRVEALELDYEVGR